MLSYGVAFRSIMLIFDLFHLHYAMRLDKTKKHDPFYILGWGVAQSVKNRIFKDF